MSFGNPITTTPFGGRRLTDTTTRTPDLLDPCDKVDVGLGTAEDNYHCDKERAGGYLPCEGRQMPASVWDALGQTGTPPPMNYPKPDCNGNGIPDGCDIQYGISQDSNGNGIPDECDAPSARGGVAGSTPPL